MKLIPTLTMLAFGTSLTFSALAESPEAAAKKTIITFQLTDSPTSAVLKKIESLSGVKCYYTAPKNDPAITLRLKDVPTTDAFSYVAKLANLSVTYNDDGAHFASLK